MPKPQMRAVLRAGGWLLSTRPAQEPGCSACDSAPTSRNVSEASNPWAPKSGTYTPLT